MVEPFVQDYRARWSDMDRNLHMRNAAFLGCAEETRTRYLDAHGWTMGELERFRVDLWLALPRTENFATLESRERG